MRNCGILSWSGRGPGPNRFAKRASSLASGRLGGRVLRPGELDPLLFWSSAVLLIFGLVMVYSSSIAFAEGSRMSGHQSGFFLWRHVVFLYIGLVAGAFAFQVPVRTWQQL
mgnify:FL=1